MSTKLPRFETEEQVREFWAGHDSTEYFDELEELPEGVTMLLPRPTITLRLDEGKRSGVIARHGFLCRTWKWKRRNPHCRFGDRFAAIAPNDDGDCFAKTARNDTGLNGY